MDVSRKTIARIMTSLLVIVMVMTVVIIPVRYEAAAEVNPVNLDAQGTIKSKGGAYLRQRATKSSKRVGLLKNKSKVTIAYEKFTTKKGTKATQKWYYVVANGKAGFVRSDLVTINSYAATTGWSTDGLNYRAGPGTGMKKKGSVGANGAFTVVMQARPYNSDQLWYKIRIGSKYYYLCGDYVTFTQPVTVWQPPVSDPNATARATVQSAASRNVSVGAVNWAVAIANDNSFHYGNGQHSHHLGCYFCGTQPTSKKNNVVEWEKTYCCNPFVHAAYAHGGNEPTMLKKCQQGGAYDWNSYKTSKLFKCIGHPDKSMLQVGDVLCWDGHVAMYAGNGNVVEAAIEDYGVHGQRWNDSISVNSLTDKEYNRFTHVYRYVGKN